MLLTKPKMSTVALVAFIMIGLSATIITYRALAFEQDNAVNDPATKTIAKDREKKAKDAEKPKAEATTNGKVAGKPAEKTQSLVHLVSQPIETDPFQAPNISLREFFGLVEDQLSKKGIELPILIDFDAFKEDDPETFKEESDVYDTKVKIPAVPRRMSLEKIIRKAIWQLPKQNATIILRDGIVQVTTLSRAAPDGLMQTEVIAVFDQRPLASAVRELSESTGVTIVLDPRTGKADTPVTATFANGVSLKTALRLMADMTGQTVVEMEGALYLTSPRNARMLRKERRGQLREELTVPWQSKKALREVEWVKVALESR